MKSPFLFSLLLIFTACTNDQLPEPTAIDCPTEVSYASDIKNIVDQSCSYAGCHISGFSPGDFSTFSGMQSVINSGAFENRVVEERSMPPSYAPDDRPKSLTEENLELIQCWIQGGYAE